MIIPEKQEALNIIKNYLELCDKIKGIKGLDDEIIDTKDFKSDDYKFFVSILPLLRKYHLNKFVIIKDQKEEGIYEFFSDALLSAINKFGADSEFIIQEI
jgi:hypothetical protein